MATAKRTAVRGKRASALKKSKAKPKPKRKAQPKRKGGPVAGTPSPMRTRLAPELREHARRQFEQTERYATEIALDCGVDESVLRRMALREGWVRYVAPPRGLPPAAKLLAEVEALETLPPVTPGDRVAAIDRLHREAMSQLAEVEALRARTTPAAKDAERNAHTLSSLTETVRKLQGMRCAVTVPGSTHDVAFDMPADPDAFRDELARRIDAFIASRANAADAGDDAAPAPDPAP